MQGVESEDFPVVGVVGIAGPVTNNTVDTTNIPHWPISDGKKIATELKMQSFTFLNDFVAAGYGVCRINSS